MTEKEESVFLQNGGVRSAVRMALADPYIWLFGLLTGIFRLNNYWDFVIYLTVAVIGFFVWALRSEHLKFALIRFTAQSLAVYVTGWIAALPFTLSFQTMQSGIALAQNHSMFYQLAILWGLPVACVAALFVFVLSRKQGKFFASMKISDMAALLYGICAVGLVVIPELIYVRDIYEQEYARSNTMFKLTYQAYILFGLVMIYALFRIFLFVKSLAPRIFAMGMLVLFVFTCGYFPDSVQYWFGNVLDRSRYQGINATSFLERDFPEDAAAIRWLDEHVEGQVPIIEARGDSYSDCAVVSAMTGIPTVLGWYVHEWLWRSDPDAVQVRANDVDAFYRAQDPETARIILEKYGVRYIYIGSNERAAYPEMNESVLLETGTVVFGDADSPGTTKIIQVGT